MKPRFKEHPAEWRKHGLTLAIPVTGLTLILCWRHVLPWSAAPCGALLAALVAGAAALRPRWFRGSYRAATWAGFYIGQVLGRVFLVVVYLLGIVPLGLLLRLLGKDPLQLKRPPGAASYWRPARPPGPLDRMF